MLYALLPLDCFSVIKLASGLLFFLPFPYLVAVFSLLYTTLLYLVAIFSLLYITLHYWGHYSLLYSTCVRFMVAGGALFVTPPLWHPASVAVRAFSWPSLCVATVVVP